MAHQFIIFAALVAVAKAGLLSGGAPLIQSAPVISSPIARTVVAEPYDPNPQYSFGYDVQDPLTGDSHGQVETRNGDVVQGSYNLLEADGTRRVVDYTADPINGFNAVVSRQAGVVAAAPAVARVAPASVISPNPLVRVAPVAVPSPNVISGPIAQVSAPFLRSVAPVVSNAPWAGSPVLRGGLSPAPWQGPQLVRSAPLW